MMQALGFITPSSSIPNRRAQWTRPNGPRITREREGWRGVCCERSETPCRRRDTQARRVHTLVRHDLIPGLGVVRLPRHVQGTVDLPSVHIDNQILA